MPALPANEWFKYAAASQELMLAVSVVYEQYKKDGRKPASEKWLISSNSFKVVMRQIRSTWAQITKLEYACFPFNKSFVRWAWLTLRKDGDGTILAWAQGKNPGLFH